LIPYRTFFVNDSHYSSWYKNSEAMSSLRLALKQSLQESGTGFPGIIKESKPDQSIRPPFSSNVSNSASVGIVRHRRRQEDPPRKRGRPRKKPIPEDGEEGSQNLDEQDNDENSSDENEFSDSETIDKSADLNAMEEKLEDSPEKSEEPSLSNSDCESTNNLQGDSSKKLKQQMPSMRMTEKPSREWKKNVTMKKISRPRSPKPQPKVSHEESIGIATSDTKRKKSNNGIVPAPSPQTMHWMSSLSIKKQRRHMSVGLRVKVRFATKVRKRDGKIVSKHKWYGGLVTAMSSGGSKIRIKYDDGTSEVAKFPDPEIFVDDEFNKEHKVTSNIFVPPKLQQNDETLKDDEDETESEDFSDTKRPNDSIPQSIAATEFGDDWNSEGGNTNHGIMPHQHSSLAEMTPKRIRDAELTDDGATIDGNVSVADEESPTLQKIIFENDNPEAKSLNTISQDNEIHLYKLGSHIDGINFEDDKSNFSNTLPEPSSIENEGGSKDAEIMAVSTFVDISVVQETIDSREVDIKVTNESIDNSDVTDNVSLVFQHQVKEVKHESVYERTKSEDEETVIEISSAPVDTILNSYDADTLDCDSSEILKTSEPDDSPFHNNDDEGHNEEATESHISQMEQEEQSEEDSDSCFRQNRNLSVIHCYKSTDKCYEKEMMSNSETEAKSSSRKLMGDSPSLELSEFKDELSPVEVTKPLSSVAIPSHENNSTVTYSIESHSHRVIASHQSAFEKSKPSKDKREKISKVTEQHGDDELSVSVKNREAVDIGINQRSGRRAAQQAIERIASRQEQVIQDSIVKIKKTKLVGEKLDVKISGKKRKEPEGKGIDLTDDDNHWVQCDRCAKWRILPSSVDVEKLPEKWYCEMNVYDPLHNSCKIPEQTLEEVAKAKRKARRRLARRARMEAEAAAGAVATVSTELSPDAELKEKEPKLRLKIQLPEKRKREEKLVEEAETFKSPSIETDLEREGKSSSGSNSDNDSKRTRNQNVKDDESLQGSKLKVILRNKRIKEVKDEKCEPKKESTKKKEDNQEWVQCEKCEKWRRLPPDVSADNLPDVWYCSMNTWDPNTSTCGAAEDKAEPVVQIMPITAPTISNKLSYRSLIFGTGKKFVRPVTERMRATESLFSSHSYADADIAGTHPTVMYANSSMFVNRSNAARAAEEKEREKPTFLDFMANSNLWAELRRLNRNRLLLDESYNQSIQQVVTLKPQKLNLIYEGLLDSERQHLKDIVYHALGTATMESNEILLEIQCQQWDGVSEHWKKLLEGFTIDLVVTIILELIKEGKVETINDATASGTLQIIVPKFRRVVIHDEVQSANTGVLNFTAPLRHSRFMKISKPWKQQVVP
jgi:CW-type Zinc Finger